ncbi:MAG: DNA-3-methyladenine glycosylase I [Candidatus Hodarchaeales archaeon]|jgi:3-methyladenine DNA glycosylase Tag
MSNVLIPPRKKPSDNREYFEILTKAVFLAGFSWKVVHNKWANFKEVFCDFEPKEIATWEEPEIDQALHNPKIIRNFKKIKATVDNSKTFLSILDEYSTFSKYLESLRPLGYLKMSKALTKQFKWLGKTGAYFFLYSVEEDVPPWEER